METLNENSNSEPDWAELMPIPLGEALGLYLLLQNNESELDEIQFQLLNRIQKKLFDLLTVDEISNLQDVYHKMKEREKW